MHHPHSRNITRAALLASALSATLLASCSPKITSVDSSYTMPEGVPSPYAEMALWVDQPVTKYFFHDNQPADPDPTDSLLFTETVQAYPTGTQRGMIIDSTQADRYQIFRRESNGGVRQLFNFPLIPTVKWLESQTEVYSFADPAPGGASSYIGRGLVSGVVTATSPLTNFPTVAPGGFANLKLNANWTVKGKIKLDWIPVPNAARYLIQVYAFRGDIGTVDEQVLTGAPSPLCDGKVSDSFVGFAPGNLDSVTVGDSTRTDIDIIRIRPMLAGAALLVRMAALDGQGHMIALTLGDPDPITAHAHGDMGLVRNALGLGTYMLYPFNATTAKAQPAPGTGGGDGSPN